MTISPTLRPLLRELLGAEEEAITDELIHLVAKQIAQVKYLDTVLGDRYDLTVPQYLGYESN